MKYLVFLILFSFGWSEASEKSCFPIGAAVHDRECYDFDSQSSCLQKDDIYSCGWGQRKEDPPSDDEILVCEDSRCPNQVDYEEESEEN